MRVLFLGSGAFGLPTLRSLHAEHELVGIVTQPDKPAGRSLRLTPTPIAQWATEHAPHTPLHRHESVNEPGVIRDLHALGADAWVVIAFGQKLSRALLNGRFAINLHASLLPRWRGAAPINHAILHGDPDTGNSVITLADRMDAGLVLGQSSRPIGPAQTAGDLHDLLAADGPALVEHTLSLYEHNDLVPCAQDESRVTLAPKLCKADGWVDFSSTAFRCARRINALSPWPGVTAEFRGAPLRLLRAEPSTHAPEQGAVPGAITDPANGLVACAGGEAVRILEVQPSGKRAMMWSDFARGQRITRDDALIGSRPC